MIYTTTTTKADGERKIVICRTTATQAPDDAFVMYTNEPDEEVRRIISHLIAAYIYIYGETTEIEVEYN